MVELQIEYGSHESVEAVVRRLLDFAESVSVAFDSWEEPYSKGPGLYIAVIADHSYDAYADPMGNNIWPVGDCPRIDADDEALYEALKDVAFTNDGAVVVSVDGVVQEQMVRFRDYRDDVANDEALAYEDWMGSRHMSALETSLRPAVVSTVTLSEESGRVSVFDDGEVQSVPRDQIGQKWRADG
jgi:diadenylate cyclase